MNFGHTFQFLKPKIHIVFFRSTKLRNLGTKEFNVWKLRKNSQGFEKDSRIDDFVEGRELLMWNVYSEMRCLQRLTLIGVVSFLGAFYPALVVTAAVVTSG